MTRTRKKVPRSIGDALALGLLVPMAFSVLLPMGLTVRADRSASGDDRIGPGSDRLEADIYGFPLRPTARARGASGSGRLRLAPSPFGVAVTSDGHLVYDLSLEVKGLRPRRTLPHGWTYVVWITTPELDRTEKLGFIEQAGTFRFRVSSMNKFILIVTLEASADVAKRSGPVMLRGISPSGLMQSFASHELFNLMPHD